MTRGITFYDRFVTEIFFTASIDNRTGRVSIKDLKAILCATELEHILAKEMVF